MREIALALGRSPSSVSRELKRNRVCGEYLPQKAHLKARVRRIYAKYQGMKIREHTELERFIQEKLRLSWSPDRIAGRWRREHPREISISAKGIYKWLYGAYGQSYCRYLKYQHYGRRKRKQTQSIREIIKGRVFIDERPRFINARKRYGDFEADTLGKSYGVKETPVGIVERKSRFVFAKRIARLGHTIPSIKEFLSGIPARSVTFDNGRENARHQELGIATYFCHPYSSWEKGQIEHVFRRVREYIPKRTSITAYSDTEITAIINRINDTPMKCLRYQTPREVFTAHLLTNP